MWKAVTVHGVFGLALVLISTMLMPCFFFFFFLFLFLFSFLLLIVSLPVSCCRDALLKRSIFHDASVPRPRTNDDKKWVGRYIYMCGPKRACLGFASCRLRTKSCDIEQIFVCHSELPLSANQTYSVFIRLVLPVVAYAAESTQPCTTPYMTISAHLSPYPLWHCYQVTSCCRLVPLSLTQATIFCIGHETVTGRGGRAPCKIVCG